MGYIKKSQNYTELYQSSLLQFFGLSIVWFFTIVLLRIVELITSLIKYGALKPFGEILQKGLSYDVIFCRITLKCLKIYFLVGSNGITQVHQTDLSHKLYQTPTFDRLWQ